MCGVGAAKFSQSVYFKCSPGGDGLSSSLTWRLLAIWYLLACRRFGWCVKKGQGYYEATNGGDRRNVLSVQRVEQPIHHG